MAMLNMLVMTRWYGKFMEASVNGHAIGSDLLEVPIPYMFGLFFRAKFQEIYPQHMA